MPIQKPFSIWLTQRCFLVVRQFHFPSGAAGKTSWRFAKYEGLGRTKRAVKSVLGEVVLFVFFRDGGSQVIQSPEISLPGEAFTEDGVQYLYF